MSSEDFFNTELAPESADKFDSNTGIVASVLGGVVASVADFGASTWNSLTPESMETSTEELLAKIDPNALYVYNENPDLIHTASFIGGLFVPAGLAMKGISAARNGSKAVNWFTRAGRVEMEADVTKYYAAGARETELFRDAVSNLKKATWGNAAIDSIGAEVAILGATNAHPFMEDYMKDPVKNFIQNSMIGVGLLGGISRIADKAVVRGIQSGVEQEAAKVTYASYIADAQELSASERLARKTTNLENWKGLLERAESFDPLTGKPGVALSGYTRNLLENMVLKEEAAIVQIFDDAASPALRALPLEEKAALIAKISDAKFLGVDSIRYVNNSDEYVTLGKAKTLVPDTSTVPLKSTDALTAQKVSTEKRLLPLVKVDDATKEMVPTPMVYSQKYEAFFTPGEYRHFGVAADAVSSVKELEALVPANIRFVPRTMQPLTRLSTNAAKVDADHLALLAHYEKLPYQELVRGGIKIDAMDIPSMQGLLSRALKEAQTNSEALSTIKAAIVNSEGKTISTVTAQEIPQLLEAAKASTIRELLRMGAPFETISIHSNVPIDTVKAFVAQGATDLGAAGAITEKGLAEAIPEYLSNANKSLHVETNIGKIPTASIKANLQRNRANVADSEIRNIILRHSTSKVGQAVSKYLRSPDLKIQTEVLRKSLTDIVESKVGGKFFTSSDFALRDLKEVGSIISSIGKDTMRLINESFENLIKPLQPSLVSISKTPAELQEFNMAIHVYNGLEGYREFRKLPNGKGAFFVQSKEEPWLEIRNAQGKVTGKERNMIQATWNNGNSLYEVVQPNVITALEKMNDIGRDMYGMHATINKMVGRPVISDLGTWFPPFNPKDRFIGYVHDIVEDKTMLLHGRTEAELIQAKNHFMQSVSNKDATTRYQYIDSKVDQALFNKMQGRHDPIFMGSADITKAHMGSSQSAVVPTGNEILSTIVGGYEHYVGYGVRSLLDHSMRDIIERFDDISHMATRMSKNQPLGKIQSFLQNKSDPGLVLKNTLLGVSDISQYGAWQSVSNLTNMGVEYGINTVGKIFSPFIEYGKDKVGKGIKATDAELDASITKMQQLGVQHPFTIMDRGLARDIYRKDSLREVPNMTPRLLALSNGLASTVMLRVMELAQPYVNAISLPILSSSAISRKLEKSFMGATLDPNAKFAVGEIMYGGARFGGSTDGMRLAKKAEELGLFKPIVSEATEALAQSRRLDKGAIPAVERALESNLVKILSTPADFTEAFTRKAAFMTGAYLGKKAYPKLGDSGLTIFARDFMDQVIGNYQAAQRPVMFQGTMGTAMGLFQTYMLTMAQQIYRDLETKNFKALGKMMLAQSTIFGARSLPGFDIVSKHIGDNFSDQNFDLTTGTYRALPDWMANVAIYGIPSNLGPAITTRGEIQPRVPNLLTEGISTIPVVNMLKQGMEFLDHVGTAAFTADASTGRAVMEAISQQSISRPLARISELFTGTSITSKGNPVYDVNLINESGEWEVRAILSRLAATRPIEEVKRREMLYLDKFYGSMDREKRQETTMRLKTYLRDGNLDSDKLESLAEEYMRHGTPRGWRSAVSKAIAETSQPASATVRNQLNPNYPLAVMMDDIE